MSYYRIIIAIKYSKIEIESIKEDYVQGAPLHSHTHISYAGTRDNSLRRACLPATVVFARGLLSPMPWFWRCFTAMGERVKSCWNFFFLAFLTWKTTGKFLCLKIKIQIKLYYIYYTVLPLFQYKSKCYCLILLKCVFCFSSNAILDFKNSLGSDVFNCCVESNLLRVGSI